MKFTRTRWPGGLTKSHGKKDNRGRAVGDWVYFLPSGVPYLFGEILDGRRHGEWRFLDFNKTGKIYKMVYDKGRLLNKSVVGSVGRNLSDKSDPLYEILKLVDRINRFSY